MEKLQTEVELLKHENNGLREALILEKRKRQRGKPLKNYLFDQDDQNAVVFSPGKIQRARQRKEELEAQQQEDQARKQEVKRQREAQKAEKERQVIERKKQADERKKATEEIKLARQREKEEKQQQRLANQQLQDEIKSQRERQRQEQATTQSEQGGKGDERGRDGNVQAAATGSLLSDKLTSPETFATTSQALSQPVQGPKRQIRV
jgi:septal ring factor EnvC (AmiA/AmiB activator)